MYHQVPIGKSRFSGSEPILGEPIFAIAVKQSGHTCWVSLVALQLLASRVHQTTETNIEPYYTCLLKLWFLKEINVKVDLSMCIDSCLLIKNQVVTSSVVTSFMSSG